MAEEKHLPEFVLFGASMVEWSFEEKTEGLGWFLQKEYNGKVLVLNEGTQIHNCLPRNTTPKASVLT